MTFHRHVHVPRDWYIGGHFIYNFMFFNEHHLTTDTILIELTDTIRHNAVGQPGFSFTVGRRINDNWRAEVEAGYLSEFRHKDCDRGTCFNLRMSAPYVSFNMTYNMLEQNWGWLYAGFGLGFAFTDARVTDGFLNTQGDTTQVSLMPSLMAGFRTRVSDTWFLDIGYRFSMMNYGRMQYLWVDNASVTQTFTNDIGWVMNHGFRVGLFYEF